MTAVALLLGCGGASPAAPNSPAAQPPGTESQPAGAETSAAVSARAPEEPSQQPAAEEPRPPTLTSDLPPCDEGPSHADYLAAVRAVFPDAYAELATVRYEHMGEDQFVIDSVTVLIPEAKVRLFSEAELAARACRAKQQLGLDCACETVELGEAKDYAWHSWPDKRVVPLTLHFYVAC